ncbi:hypothetical protein N9N67_00335 [Bacteriovoracaceae bacterium]|nr:hypothetical protein [Bacteriovoracaceae bacterium]
MRVFLLLIFSFSFAFGQNQGMFLTKEWVRATVNKELLESRAKLVKVEAILMENEKNGKTVIDPNLLESVRNEVKRWERALLRLEKFNEFIVNTYIFKHYSSEEAMSNMKNFSYLDSKWDYFQIWLRLEDQKEEESKIKLSGVFDQYKGVCLDLSEKFNKPVYQKNSWSCVPQAITAVTEFHINNDKENSSKPIQLSPYYAFAQIQEKRMGDLGGCSGEFKFTGFHITDFIEPLTTLEEEGICLKSYFNLYDSEENPSLKGGEISSIPKFPPYYKYKLDLSKKKGTSYFYPKYESGYEVKNNSNEKILKDLIGYLMAGKPPVLGIKTESREVLNNNFANYIPGSMRHAVTLMGFCYPEGSDEPYFTIWDSKSKSSDFIKVKASDLIYNLLQVHIISGAEEKLFDPSRGN